MNGGGGERERGEETAGVRGEQGAGGGDRWRWRVEKDPETGRGGELEN